MVNSVFSVVQIVRIHYRYLKISRQENAMVRLRAFVPLCEPIALERPFLCRCSPSYSKPDSTLSRLRNFLRELQGGLKEAMHRTRFVRGRKQDICIEKTFHPIASVPHARNPRINLRARCMKFYESASSASRVFPIASLSSSNSAIRSSE